MKKKCWASSLGNCAGKLSREHIVSSSFFEGQKDVVFTGCDWTGDNQVQIPLKRAVAKILCRKHNSQLSNLDEEIKTTGKVFRQYFEEAANRKTDETHLANKKVDGAKLERWLLKTTLNFICSSPKIYNNFWPDNYLASLVFGNIKFDYENKMGLYFIHPNFHNSQIDVSNSLNVRPAIISSNGHNIMLGVLITFWGMPFFLKTAPKTENLRLEMRGVNLIDEKLYHLKLLNSFSISMNGFEKIESNKITFTYNQ